MKVPTLLSLAVLLFSVAPARADLTIRCTSDAIPDHFENGNMVSYRYEVSGTLGSGSGLLKFTVTDLSANKVVYASDELKAARLAAPETTVQSGEKIDLGSPAAQYQANDPAVLPWLDLWVPASAADSSAGATGFRAAVQWQDAGNAASGWAPLSTCTTKAN